MSVGDVASTERGSGARYNDGKPDFSLIPLDIIARSLSSTPDFPADGIVSVVVPSGHLGSSLYQLGLFQRTGDVRHLDLAIKYVRFHWADTARVFEYGKHKYAAWNWAKGMAWSIPLACAGRHAVKVLYLNEELDDESRLPHAGHYLANLVMLRTFVETYPEGNDLPPPELFRTAPITEETR